MYSLTKTTADGMLPAMGGWSLTEAVLAAGQSTADNQPARLARMQYSWRCPDVASAEAVLAVLDRNARLAADAAHCLLDTRWVARNRPGLPNHELATATWANLRLVGAPRWGEPAREVARRNWTSDDYVEMTWYAPTARFYVARPTLTTADGCGDYPAWVLNALGGIPETIDPMIRTAGNVVAGTLIDLFLKPELLRRAKAEHARRVAEYGNIAPLLPADFTPPTELNWPDYITGPAGRQWPIAADDVPHMAEARS
ncbi:MAG: hypothetical protein GEV04_18295 [Actinophytocola sp.]|nr:hypothetical protein [Actinophytocola sp.]